MQKVSAQPDTCQIVDVRGESEFIKQEFVKQNHRKRLSPDQCSR
ncbi:uncharacterized protein METZ01_LOCUS115866 [marine metagenome]|uniref:Uncharacterized protein n=1 Tax=marine metagenome TaxID=408172 RepID=A0A381XEQ1_9ZZZZ